MSSNPLITMHWWQPGKIEMLPRPRSFRHCFLELRETSPATGCCLLDKPKTPAACSCRLPFSNLSCVFTAKANGNMMIQNLEETVEVKQHRS
ncbi:hypothetical protein LIER_26577 [Lithospermum erythrorhizon]|uniref:Uncharacterized protein n=1 Tax=Lithospermum erythrorhizon TaxID=34254 RepID=A0AAV3RCW4_LITER